MSNSVLQNETTAPAVSGDGINHLGRRIQEIVEQIESLPDPAARALMQECMESVLGFYGQGLERILQVVKRSGVGGQKVHDDLIHDSVVRGLLLIHGLHPDDLPTRLREALDKVRPYMESHGGNVELLSLENDFARLRLQGACKTCPSSAVTLELAVRHAIEEACPDLLGFEVEGAPAKEEHEHQPKAAPDWVEVESAAHLDNGALISVQVANVPLVICKLAGQLYAYRDRCPACNMPLHLGALFDGALTCRAGHHYSVHDAGRGESHGTHLDPFPLLSQNGSVKVAVAHE